MLHSGLCKCREEDGASLGSNEAFFKRAAEAKFEKTMVRAREKEVEI